MLYTMLVYGGGGEWRVCVGGRGLGQQTRGHKSAVRRLLADLHTFGAFWLLLDIPFVRLSTVGGRAFDVAGPRIWNSLPAHVISAETLTTFRQRLKAFLFEKIIYV